MTVPWEVDDGAELLLILLEIILLLTEYSKSSEFNLIKDKTTNYAPIEWVTGCTGEPIPMESQWKERARRGTLEGCMCWLTLALSLLYDFHNSAKGRKRTNYLVNW